MEQAVSFSWTMAEPPPEATPCESDSHTVASTVNLDTVEAIELLCAQGLRPAALNFAHEYNCGGGFEHSDGSQEEDLFRKTSCFLSLWPHRRSDDGPGVLARGIWIGEYDEALPRKEAYYPHTECGGIYSPHVRIIRSSTRLPQQHPAAAAGGAGPGGRKAAAAPFWPADQVDDATVFGMISLAAQNVPRTHTFNPELLRQKVRAVCRIAVEQGHDSLVLGAFGCGYFGNPNHVVASTFCKVLKEEFANHFRAVLYAIPGPLHGTNLRAFAEVFGLQSPKELRPLLAEAAAAATASSTGERS